MKLVKSLLAAGLASALLLTACHHKRPDRKAKDETLTVVPVATLYGKGQEALKKNKAAAARRYFDQISLREDAGDYKDKAAIATADAFYVEHTLEAYAEAISRYQSFLAFHPTHPEAAYCQFRIGEAWFAEMDSPDRDTSTALNARQAYQSVVENYPNSTYASPAEKKLSQVNDLLAAHEVRIGDWYLRENHPKGAIARYRGVVERYPKYWNMPVVYSRLGEALYRDGQGREALLYFTRLTQEAPGTNLAKDAQKWIDHIRRREAASDKKERDAAKDPVPSKKKHWFQFWK